MSNQGSDVCRERDFWSSSALINSETSVINFSESSSLLAALEISLQSRSSAELIGIFTSFP